MIPVMQTEFAKRGESGEIVKCGNCMAACVASILEKSIDEIPTLRKLDQGFCQSGALMEYLNSIGCTLGVLGGPDGFHPLYSDCYYIACGPAKRGFSHAVVYRYGRLAHDPHPDGTGIDEVTTCYVICGTPK